MKIQTTKETILVKPANSRTNPWPIIDAKATPFAKSEKNPANNLSCSFVNKIFLGLAFSTQFYFGKLYAKMQAVMVHGE